MRKLIFIVCFGAAFFGLNNAFAQQDPQFSFYMLNKLYYNPGFAGTEGLTKITLLHRSQWAGYTGTFEDGGAPTTQLFSVTSPIYKFKSGFGAYVVNDNLGPLNNLEVQASYAYHLGIKNSKLSFGVQAGIFSQSIGKGEYRFIDSDDPVILESAESQVRPDLSLGIYFRNEKYYAGVSFKHLLNSEFDFGVPVRNALETHGYFMFGYIYTVNFDLVLEPSMMVSTDFNEYSFILGGMAYYKEQMWGGVTFRQSEDINVLLGYNFLKDKSLSFGYSFGYVVKDQDAKQPTTHEFVLSYQLPPTARVSKRVVRTPRYRHD